MKTVWRIRLCGNSWIIHLVSTDKPYLNGEGRLIWTPYNEQDSDALLMINWNCVDLISIREVNESEVIPKIKDNSTVDLKNPFKSTEILTAKDNKKYVSLMRATELIREAAKR